MECDVCSTEFNADDGIEYKGKTYDKQECVETVKECAEQGVCKFC